jgi:hypothetical protein
MVIETLLSLNGNETSPTPFIKIDVLHQLKAPGGTFEAVANLNLLRFRIIGFYFGEDS